MGPSDRHFYRQSLSGDQPTHASWTKPHWLKNVGSANLALLRSDASSRWEFRRAEIVGRKVNPPGKDESGKHSLSGVDATEHNAVVKRK